LRYDYISRSPKLLDQSSPNAGGTVVDNVLEGFWISSSVLEIFAIEVQSHPKLCQILHVFGPWKFF